MTALTGFLGSLKALIERYTARVDFALPYRATVLAQGADGTVDVRFAMAAMPDALSVPVYYGLPGCSSTFAAGAQVLVEFAEADPSRPFVRSWATGAVNTTLLLGSDSAAHSVAWGDVLGLWASTLTTALKAHTHTETGSTTSVSPALATLTVPAMASTIAKVP